MSKYHYYDLVEERYCDSTVQLLSNGLRRVSVLDDLDKPAHAANSRALLLHDLSAAIGKQQRKMITDDREQMWRYWNNARVARMVVAGEADPDLLSVFGEMLQANQDEDPAFYGGMSPVGFAAFLLRLDRKFMLDGISLETQRIRRRMEIAALSPDI
ncbi:hypothetical protein [Thiothrix nivea]|uniref:Uncharacterized protein n=1 Tax=Thiothrix nivea (strain ATCC 35100 / DSM 5205 / JP2) TaxID=870187 RepID=A0A656HCX3_THINJ|nr:hypothetical protein [Thiothrix nivea]EIJ33310.1 hypothetical protein Thini_0673 [Thiothrix nivea DSM 5205]